jgi:hypothetical protein
MKKRILLMACMIAVFTACQDNEAEPSNAIEPEEAAVIVGSSLASNSAGFSRVSAESASKTEVILQDNANGRVVTCGLSQNLDLSGSSPVGGLISWSYNFSYNFRLNCSSDETPDNVTVGLSYSGVFDKPSFGFEFSGLSDLELRGLSDTADFYSLSGDYNREGSFEIKEGEQKSGSNALDLTFSDVEIDKTTYKITSGSSSFKLNGTVSDQGTFNYEGTITFTGSDMAEIAINNEVYLLNMIDGTVAQK